VRRCEAVQLKRGAKLYAICAAFLRGEAGFHCLGAEFEYHQMAQDSSPRSIDPNATLTSAARSSFTLTDKILCLRRGAHEGEPRHVGPCVATSCRHAARLNSRSSGGINSTAKRHEHRGSFRP
jgi:hypothetical protein